MTISSHSRRLLVDASRGLGSVAVVSVALVALAACGLTSPAAGGSPSPSTTAASSPSSPSPSSPSPTSSLAAPLAASDLLRITAVYRNSTGGTVTATETLQRPDPTLAGTWSVGSGNCATTPPASPSYLQVVVATAPAGDWDGTKRLTADAETMTPTTVWSAGVEPVQAYCTAAIVDPSSRITGVLAVSGPAGWQSGSFGIALEDPTAAALVSCTVDGGPGVPASVIARLTAAHPDYQDLCGDVVTS